MNHLTATEVASELGITISLVHRYCRDGRIVAQRFGNQWEIGRAQLNRFKNMPRKAGRPKGNGRCR